MRISFIFIFAFLIFACVKHKMPMDDNASVSSAYENRYIYKPGKKLNRNDLTGLTKLELMLMKAEIYARAGKLHGKNWQKMYIKFRKWFKPGEKRNLTTLEKKNLEIINSEIENRKVLVKNVEKPKNVKATGKYTNLEFNKNKTLKRVYSPMKKNHWDYLLNKEYAKQKTHEKLASILKKYKGLSGFYVIFEDNNGVERLIIDYSGCCGIILSNEPRNVYIFSKNRRLLKRAKFFHDKKEEEWFYFYKNGKIQKGIFVIYNIKTQEIIEADIMTGNKIE